MSETYFKNTSILAALLTLGAAAAVLGFKGLDAWRWAAGFLVGGAWMFFNFFFLFRLLRISLREVPAKSDQVLLLSILKFPVLYLSGFLILKNQVFPAYALVGGLSIFMACIVGGSLRANFMAKEAGRAAS